MADPRRKPRPSQNSNRTPDPFSPDPSEAGLGAAAFKAGENVFERGTILSSDSQRQTYYVVMNSGRPMTMSRIRAHPGDVTMLPNGTVVAVTFALGLPYIFGVLPPETAAYEDDNPTSITDADGFGGNDALMSRSLGANARGANEPRDSMPGDFVGTGPDGSSVAALRGQTAQLRGSALAKVTAFGDNDLVQIVAGVLRVLTWMGESKVVNDQGKTSYIWRGGTDQLTQTGQDEERYTIKLDVGHTGNMIKLEVCNRDNQTVFSFHVDPQGRVDLFAAGGFQQHSGASETQVHPVRVHGSVEETVTGSVNRRSGGDVTEAFEGSVTESISNNKSETIGQDKVVSVSRNSSEQVGADKNTVVTGNAVTNVRGNNSTNILDAGKFHAVKTNNGEMKHETQGGKYTIKTDQGDIELSLTSGAVRIKAGADKIELGNNPSSHAVKWEELNAVLQQLLAKLNVFFMLLTTHIHPVSGPTTAPAAQLIPLAEALTLTLDSAKSTSTKLV